MLLRSEHPSEVEVSKVAVVDESENCRGKVGKMKMRNSRQYGLSTLEDGLAEAHTLSHLPAEHTARSSDASRPA